MIQLSIDIVVVLIGGGFALLGTILGAYLNKRTALSTAKELAEIERFKYTQDRIWDFRKEAYTEILAHLKEASNYAERVRDGYHDEQMHPEAYHGSDRRPKDEAAAWDAWTRCKTAFVANRLTLSEDFTAEFQSLRDALGAIDEHDLPPDIAWAEAECYSAAYPKLLNIALAEIAPSSPARIEPRSA